MFTKQVSLPVDGRDPIVAAEAEHFERTRRKTWSRARSEFSVPFSIGSTFTRLFEMSWLPLPIDSVLLLSGKTHPCLHLPTMFTKQVSRPVDRLDTPSWPPRRRRSSELDKDLVTGPIRGVLYPTGCNGLTDPRHRKSPAQALDSSFCALQEGRATTAARRRSDISPVPHPASEGVVGLD
jgi:hypothetical protein